MKVGCSLPLEEYEGRLSPTTRKIISVNTITHVTNLNSDEMLHHKEPNQLNYKLTSCAYGVPFGSIHSRK